MLLVNSVQVVRLMLAKSVMMDSCCKVLHVYQDVSQEST